MHNGMYSNHTQLDLLFNQITFCVKGVEMIFEHNRGKPTIGQVGKCQVRTSPVGTGHVKSRQFKSIQVKSGQVN